MTQGMPPLKCLLTFTTVMEHGSFARAADELHVTPSAVSHQIRALETMLGKSLFVRARRSVQPTADAVAYAETIRESFSRIAVATSRFIARAGTRRLRVHSSPSFATLWLLPRLASFQRRHPDIDVSLGAAHEPARLGEDGYMINIQHARPIPEECDGLVLAE
ncbi:MAG: LysR family transcriptional regulator, partial [Alphaproteobacteria bacterium]